MQKHIFFNGQKLTLFSLDGVTWSSRKTELPQIRQRQEAIKDKIRSNFKDQPQEEQPEADNEQKPAVKAKQPVKVAPKKRASTAPKKNPQKKKSRRVA